MYSVLCFNGNNNILFEMMVLSNSVCFFLAYCIFHSDLFGVSYINMISIITFVVLAYLLQVRTHICFIFLYVCILKINFYFYRRQPAVIFHNKLEDILISSDILFLHFNTFIPRASDVFRHKKSGDVLDLNCLRKGSERVTQPGFKLTVAFILPCLYPTSRRGISQ